MNKKLALVAMVLAAVSLTGCQLMDSLFFNTEEVKASEVATFTGSTPSTKDEALTSVMAGGGTVVLSMMSAVSAPAPAIFKNIFPVIKGSEQLYGKASAIARTISPVDSSYGFEAFMKSVDSTGAGTANVTYTGESFGTDGFITLDGTVQVKAKGFTESSTAASGEVKADLSADVAELPSTAFNGGKLNFKMNANGEATLSAGVPATMSGYSAIALSAGISLDAVEGVSKGGKYIISMKYTSNFKYDATATDPTSSLTAEVSLKVYDASNKLVGDYKYTDDEIQALVSGS